MTMATRRLPGQALYRPEIGELVLDQAIGKEGTYQGVTMGRAYLRPAGGGIEWPTVPWELAQITTVQGAA